VVLDVPCSFNGSQALFDFAPQELVRTRQDCESLAGFALSTGESDSRGKVGRAMVLVGQHLKKAMVDVFLCGLGKGIDRMLAKPSVAA
jgi:hypothetical protein